MVNLDVLSSILKCKIVQENRFDIELYGDNKEDSLLYIYDDVPLGALVDSIEHEGTYCAVVNYLILANENMTAAECIQKIVNTGIYKIVNTIQTEEAKEYLKITSFVDKYSVSSWSIKCSVTGKDGLLLKVQYPLNGYRLD